MPRSYNSEKRKQLEDEMRERIVAATVKLHAEKGPMDTSYKDIAQKADVATPTVYKYFPNLSNLFFACTRHAAKQAPAQSEDDFNGLDSMRDRVAALVHMRCRAHAYFDPWLRWGGERVIPEVVSLLQDDSAMTRKLILKALFPVYPQGKVPKEIMRMTLMLVGYHAWANLQAEVNISQKQIETYLVNSICKLIEQ